MDFVFQNSLYAVFLSAVLIGCVVLALLIYLYFKNKIFIKQEKMQHILKNYLPADIAKKLVKNPKNAVLGGSRANVTVLFADIRNFTSIVENTSIDLVSSILNEYFSEMVPIIEKNDGVLNKFMGDALLAVFGGSKESQNHAYNAIKCADMMLKKIEKLSQKWLDMGRPKIEIGIGVATGDAFIGNIGSKERFEYTVIGDVVNTANRIENYNKVYKTKFLVSESTYSEVSAFVDAITIKNVKIRGKSSRLNVYEIVRLKSRVKYEF